jgi:ribonuclease-3
LSRNLKHKLLKIPLFKKKKTNEELDVIRFVLAQFGYKPQNVSFFIQALTHKSSLSDQHLLAANERLEFLGDSILDAVVASFVYEKYPDLDEGQLTKIKSKQELLGELIGMLQSPMQTLVGSLQYGSNTIGGLLKTLEERG